MLTNLLQRLARSVQGLLAGLHHELVGPFAQVRLHPLQPRLFDLRALLLTPTLVARRLRLTSVQKHRIRDRLRERVEQQVRDEEAPWPERLRRPRPER